MDELKSTFTLPPNSSNELIRGIELFYAKKYREAEEFLSLCPEVCFLPEVCFHLGTAQHLAEKPNKAIETWKRTLKLDATFTPALINLGLAYSNIQDYQNAYRFYSRLLNIEPDHKEGRFHFANLLFQIGHTQEAINVYADLTHEKPVPNGVLINLGRALRRSGKLVEADACYQEALAKKPDDPFILWNRSHVLFLLNKWAEGFAAWEARLNVNVKIPLTPNFPEWKKGKPPERLLVIAEQGHGDTIQCLRYIPTLLNLGCMPTIALHSALISFAQKLFPDLHFVTFKEILKIQAEAWVPIFSLPHRLNLPNPTDTPPLSGLYAPSKATQTSHKNRTRPPQIGLVWAGNPGHDNDSFRSMPIEALVPLFTERPDIQWQSLQLGDRKDLEQLAPELRPTPIPDVNDFADTAALINKLDLVICVDTAVAHISGTIGTQTWLMLAMEPDWRWGQTQQNTPWYPSARLFRQKKLGEWAPVIDDILHSLEKDFPQNA